VTPEAHAERGSQVSLRCADAGGVMRALIARGVVGDFRQPDLLRFGFTPLYTRYADAWHAARVLADILDARDTAGPGTLPGAGAHPRPEGQPEGDREGTP
jgi:kynureninase